MKYHFKVHKEGRGYWGECIELKGCLSQGGNSVALRKNLSEALNLYLDEPEDSKLILPLPRRKVSGKNIVEIGVDPQIALAFLVRTQRLKKKWTQKVAAEQVGIPLYSYQKLECSRTANPEWKTLIKLRRVFPQLNLNQAA